ncbi:hypothetical protein ACLQ2R_01175 [Streptosporangium sp. DT93]|uniref:hypothetical protein n=1 Tax=Streptosporangium sp. DT93 TaxID=3393428 RepID=UPI003CFB1C87
MPFDGLIDAVVTAFVLPALPLLPLSAWRPGRVSRASAGPSVAGMREATRPRCAAETAPGPLTASGQRTAFADDFGATVVWRYPEGVRPVRAFDPKAFEAGMPAQENTEKNRFLTDPRDRSPDGRTVR